jgi:hypothetical protein
VSERVGDRDITPAVIASAGTIMPDAARWTVVLDADGQPVAAIAPGGASVAEDLVVADAATPIADALESEALAYATAGTVVVVTERTSVVGVWSGKDLIDALLHGATRGASRSLPGPLGSLPSPLGSLPGSMPGDMQLPGRITKKDITRRCRHTEQAHSCATVLVVPEKPEVMPQCPAQDGISSHVFAW